MGTYCGQNVGIGSFVDTERLFTKQVFSSLYNVYIELFVEIVIPISILCGKMKERNLCLYTMWKGMNSINGTSNHTSGLAFVSG